MLIPTFGRHLLKFWVEIKMLEKPRWANWNSFCWLLQWTSMNGRQLFSIHIVLKCQRSSETQTFARLQHFCTFVIEIKDRMQYCMEESKRGCRARALGIGTRLLYALRAALRAARAGVIIYLSIYLFIYWSIYSKFIYLSIYSIILGCELGPSGFFSLTNALGECMPSRY